MLTLTFTFVQKQPSALGLRQILREHKQFDPFEAMKRPIKLRQVCLPLSSNGRILMLAFAAFLDPCRSHSNCACGRVFMLCYHFCCHLVGIFTEILGT
jgi:hypothetical protein